MSTADMNAPATSASSTSSAGGTRTSSTNNASSSTRTADVAVIGVGTIGSMALWHLSKMRGDDGKPLRVVGIEQFGTVHSNGSFSGESRLFRVAAKEGVLFTPWLIEAREQWLELGRLSGRDLLVPAGTLHLAPEGHPDATVAREAMETYHLPHRYFSADEVRKQFPQFAVEDGDVGVFDELGGAIRPESAVLVASQFAEANGAEILYNTEVLSVEPVGTGVRVTTTNGVVEAGRVIVTAGSWTTRVLPELKDILKVASYALTWFMPSNIGLFGPARLPGFMRDFDDMHAFGAPSIEGFSVKVCPHIDFERVDDWADRTTTLSREQLLWLGQQAQRIFPSLNPEPVRWSVHPDSETTDHRPIIDSIEDGRVVLATGMSGNGFKFAPVYGQAAAELAATARSAWHHDEFTLAHQRALTA